MYVCMCIRKYVYSGVGVFVYGYVCMWLLVRVCAFVRELWFIYLWAFVCVGIYVRSCLSKVVKGLKVIVVVVCICVCVNTCVFMYSCFLCGCVCVGASVCFCGCLDVYASVLLSVRVCVYVCVCVILPLRMFLIQWRIWSCCYSYVFVDVRIWVRTVVCP